MQSLVDARYGGRTGEGATFDLAHGWQCRVFVLAEDLFRVLLLRDRRLKEPRSWMVAPHGLDVPWEGRERLDTSGFPKPRHMIDERETAVTVTAGRLRVEVALRPFGLRWTMDGEVFATDRTTSAYHWSERTEVLRHYMARHAEDRYYGLGDKSGPLDKHGRRFRTLALDALGYDAATSDPLYKHWPYLITRDAGSGVVYGTFYDTLAPTTFDLGCEYDNYHGYYRYAEIEDGDLDYYVFVGPRLRDVVRKFAELTGRMAFGPRWSLGYANTAMSLTDAPDAQAQLSAFVDRVVEHDIPLSAFHFGSGYTSIGKRRYVFTWNHSKFPAPRDAIAKFHQHDARVVVNLKPCLLDDHPAFAEVAARGGFVGTAGGGPAISQFWDGEGAHVDFTHPEGIRWWQSGLREQVLDYGIDSGWNDNNEYELWDDRASSHGFGTAIPIRRSRPLHALLMTRATAEAQAAHRPDERVYTVTRAGPPGIQRYAQTWSGDNTTSWHTLKWNLRMGLGMSLSGMFNTGHDVGGFAGEVPDPELLVRWVQNGVFSPRFIMNSWKPDGTVNTPWLHPQVLPAIRDAIRFRYRLLPYLYTLYRRAATAGEPILRPTFFDFDDDPRAFDDSDDFMCGPNLLVANVVEAGARRREIYLPQGPKGWYDFHSGALLQAGQKIVVDAPLGRIPLMVPAGGIVPMTSGESYARLHDEPSRTLHVFPAPGAHESAFTLYEDDGRTLRYRDGDHAILEATLQSTSREVSLSVRASGAYALPYWQIAVGLPPGETRRLSLRGEGVDLVAAN